MASYKQVARISTRNEAGNSSLILKLLIFVRRVCACGHFSYQVYSHHVKVSNDKHQATELRILDSVFWSECGFEKVNILLCFFTFAGQNSVCRHRDLLERDDIQLLAGAYQRGEYLLGFPFGTVACYYLKIQLSVRLLVQLF